VKQITVERLSTPRSQQLSKDSLEDDESVYTLESMKSAEAKKTSSQRRKELTLLSLDPKKIYMRQTSLPSATVKKAYSRQVTDPKMGREPS
jgi:hypothetical protein